jgi:hypothetical protein
MHTTLLIAYIQKSNGNTFFSKKGKTAGGKVLAAWLTF